MSVTWSAQSKFYKLDLSGIFLEDDAMIPFNILCFGSFVGSCLMCLLVEPWGGNARTTVSVIEMSDDTFTMF